jgi:hypothetical protein
MTQPSSAQYDISLRPGPRLQTHSSRPQIDITRKTRPMYGLPSMRNLDVHLYAASGCQQCTWLGLAISHTLKYVELCRRRFSSVKQRCPDWTVFLVFIVFMLSRPPIVDCCQYTEWALEVLTRQSSFGRSPRRLTTELRFAELVMC